ncbi:hypothetical protein RJ55_03856 [Drechmeria coniospora]|nr:hypothetical protein RJ55_03856 [Drechmeria coniospora]
MPGRVAIPHMRQPIKDESDRNDDPDGPLSDDSDTSSSNQTHRNARSDAPALSEHTTGTEPLLREVRVHPSLVATGASNSEGNFFHTSFQDIGKKLKDFNDTLGELQQLGVSHDVQLLPELVLVGDQSAGKSSLMSGLANLDLPRSEGTCTRCPLHIRVSRNNTWSCRVWLRKAYVYQPPPDRPICEKDVTPQDPFFPWRQLPASTVVEFKSMQDKSEIEDVLRWAQIAILNDNKNHTLFVPGSGPIALNTPIATAAEETLAKFSPNVVALEIKGPDLPDLSFYDMPGIFQNPADDRDDYLVHVVRNLSSDYMSHPSAIVICSMPMNSDAENSSTFRLTRRLKASSRTIGVLTKADLLPEGGNHDQWLAIMKGEAHTAGLGYFITSRPQGLDLDALKAWEECIFEARTTQHWPSSFHQFTERCGVERLKDFLSVRLGEEFAKSLPKIKQKLENHLEKINKELSILPELPDNVELKVRTGLMSFADSARFQLDKFIRHFNKLPRSFRNCLLEIKPKFTLRDRTDIPVLEISDDESDAVSVMTNNTTPTAKRHATFGATPSKRMRMETSTGMSTGGSTGGGAPHSNGINTEGANGARASASLPPPSSARGSILQEPFTEFRKIGHGFRTLRQVRQEMQAKTKAGMPDRVSDEVYFDMVKEAITPWDRPTMALMTQAMRELQSLLETTLGTALAGLKKRSIYQEAKKYVRKCLEEHCKETEAALMQLYEDERERLLTFNDEAFKEYCDSEQVILTRFRHKMRLESAGLPSRPLGEWSDFTDEKRSQDVKRREAEVSKIGPDQFAREIEVISYVRAYYRLAALRFADAVSQRILCRMIPAIRMKLPDYLEESLGLRGPDTQAVYERLMAEDDKTAKKREMLKRERNKFTKALASIELLETGAGSGDVEMLDESTQPLSRIMDADHQDDDLGET